MRWIAGWGKRIKFEIDHTKVNSNLTNFPVLVNLGTTYSGVFAELGNNYKKIAFMNPDTREEYYCEVERWDSTNKSAQLWVRIPTINSGTNTTFYMLYDGTHGDNTTYVGSVSSTAGQKVWDNNFVAVYHMSQDPSTGGACILDSTSNENHGTPNGSMTSADLVDANVGKGLDFDGSDDYVSIPSAIYDTSDTELTIELSAKCDTTSSENRAFAYNNDGTYQKIVYNWGSSGKISYASYDGSTNHTVETTNYTVTSHHNLAYTAKESGTLYGYVDGIMFSSTSCGSFNTTSTLGQNIGASRAGTTNFDGIVREVRLSNIIRSADWLKTTHYSNFDQLLIKGSEETVVSGTLDYANKLKIIIPHGLIDNTLYDFPVLLNLSSNSGLNNVSVLSIFEELGHYTNRKKIAITDYTGVSECYTEISYWSQYEAEAQLWVKVPVIYSTKDTVLYLYYDKDADDNGDMVGDIRSTPAERVWDSNFKAVYHLNQDPSLGGTCIHDSTSNNYDGSPQGDMPASSITDTDLGKCLLFDGSDDYIDIASTYFDNLTKNFTIEAVGNAYTTCTPISKVHDANDQQFSIVLQSTSIVGNYEKSNNDFQVEYSCSPLNNFHYTAFSVSTALTCKLYLDGINVATDSTTSEVSTSIDNLEIGRLGGTYQSSYFNGPLKEIRISDITRSDLWMKISYYSMFDELVCYDTTITDTWLKTYENGSLVPWAKRIKIEVDNSYVDEPLEDFPVLINVTDDSGISHSDLNDIFTTVSGSSYKIAVTSDDGVTQLPVEIERWDTTSSGTGEAQLWIKVPFIKNYEKTTLYLYYDKDKPDNTDYVGYIGSTVGMNVWSNDFIAVYHLSQDPSTGGACIKDSTSKSKHGTPNGSMTSSDLVNANVGRGLDFDGSDDYIELPSSTIDGVTQCTWEVQFKSDDSNTNQRPIIHNNNNIFFAIDLNGCDDNCIRTYLKASSGGGWTQDLTTYNVTEYRYTVGSFDENYLYFNVDDSVIGSPISYTGLEDVDSDYHTRIGAARNDTYFFDGIIREVRFSSTKRSNGWIKTTYYSNFDNLLIYSSVETPPQYCFTGKVFENDSPVVRQVYLYLRNTGELIDSTTSSENGSYLVKSPNNTQHFIVVLDDDDGVEYQALIHDRLLPNA